MKRFKIILFALLFLGFGISGASAVPVLYDWGINVDANYYNAADTYLPPEVNGEITGVNGFSMFTPAGNPYGFEVPEAIGTVAVTFDPGIAGTYNIEGWFDVEIDEWINTYYNESGAAHGTASTGQYGNADEVDPTDPGDIYWYMGWDFDLAADEYATVSFILSDIMPNDGFYLSQTDNDTGESIYLSSTLQIFGETNEVPEPSTLLLVGAGLLGLCGFGRRKFKKQS